MNILKTRKELEDEGKLDLYPYSIVSEVYLAMHKGIFDGIHMPHSDVYFVRMALEKHTGYWFPLNVVEEAMRQEGWRDKKQKKKRKYSSLVTKKEGL